MVMRDRWWWMVVMMMMIPAVAESRTSEGGCDLKDINDHFTVDAGILDCELSLSLYSLQTHLLLGRGKCHGSNVM